MKRVRNQSFSNFIGVLHKYRRSIAVFFLIIFSGVLIDSCSFYKRKDLYAGQFSIDTINKNLAKGKQFVLQTASETWQVYRITDLTQTSITLSINLIPSLLQDKLNDLELTKSKRVKRVNKIIQQLVILHVNNQTKIETGEVVLPLNEITKIEVYDNDLGKSILIGVGIAAVAFGILMLIVWLTKSSCPFVYSFNGENYTLAGESFGGAIYPGLERNDFIPITDVAAIDRSYQFKIRNELKEEQFINKVGLIEAVIPTDKSLLIDQSGKIYSISATTPPLTAISGLGISYQNELKEIDSSSFYFNEEKEINSLTFEFDNPRTSQEAKLVLKTRSTFWMDYVFGEFLNLFGIYYNTFAENQKSKTKEEMGEWSVDQHLPLTVSVLIDDEWRIIDRIQPIGPLAPARDIVVPIDLKDINMDKVQVKLSTGFMFWEIDYAAIDFSANSRVEMRYSNPHTTLVNSEPSDPEHILYDDQLYQHQANVGDVLDISFRKQFSDTVQTKLFLEVSGYYLHKREFNHLPDLALLNTFKNPGRLSEYSYDLYLQNAPTLLTYFAVQD